MIIDRLHDRVESLNNPTVVGLDPQTGFLPGFLLEEAIAKHGKTVGAVTEALFNFNAGIIDAVYDIVPAVKPQIAMYERFGVSGYDCYMKTVAYAKSKGLIVIGDIKRCDIASTADAYADAHLGRSDIGGIAIEGSGVDFVTINAYLGEDGVEPFKKRCAAFDKGMFILVKTSNPNSGQIQDITEAGTGRKIYEVVGAFVEQWGSDMIGECGYSAIGAVVGATHKEQARELRALMPHTLFLVPGYGAQGGKAEDVAVCFDKNGFGAIVNSSRGIIAAYKSGAFASDERDFAGAARAAAIAMKDDINKYR